MSLFVIEMRDIPAMRFQPKTQFLKKTLAIEQCYS